MSDDELMKSPLFTYIPYYNDNELHINIINKFTQCKYYKDLTPLNLNFSKFSIIHILFAASQKTLIL